VVLAVLLLTCCLTAPANATIDTETIALGALIPFPAADPRASISLGYAPNPGLARRIAKHEIVRKIEAAGLKSDDLQLPDSILVHREAATLDRDQVTSAVLDAFMKQFPDTNIEIVSVEIPKVQIGTGAVQITASLPARFDLVNSVFVRLDIRGTSFSRNAFARTRVKIEGEQGAIRSNAAAPAAAPIVVKKGDSVTVRSTAGAVSIAATMRAKGAGKVGDTIPVEHLSGSGSTMARIVAPGTLEINLGTK
jgi:hypothetical protein